MAGFLAEAWFSGARGWRPDPVAAAADAADDRPPFIADPTNTLEDKHWFLISDLAAVVEMLTKNLSLARP